VRGKRGRGPTCEGTGGDSKGLRGQRSTKRKKGVRKYVAGTELSVYEATPGQTQSHALNQWGGGGGSGVRGRNTTIEGKGDLRWLTGPSDIEERNLGKNVGKPENGGFR